MNEEDNTKIQNDIKEVSKGKGIIMGDFNHGRIKWKTLDSTGPAISRLSKRNYEQKLACNIKT